MILVWLMKNSNIIQQLTYQSAEDFLNDLSYGRKLFSLKNSSYVFRGQSHSHYELLPSALRSDISDLNRYLTNLTQDAPTEQLQILNEASILYDFFKSCDYNGLFLPQVERFRNIIFSFFDFKTILQDEMWLPEDLFEIAALAQHYGLPTRLLDWTYDINTAIYFALSEFLQKSENQSDEDYLVIWGLDTKISTKSLFFEAMKNEGEKSIVTIDEFLIRLTSKRFPLRIIRPQYYGNPNLSAQKGVFTLWEVKKNKATDGNDRQVDKRPLDVLLLDFFSSNEKITTLLTRPILYKILLPNREINKLYHFLKSNHIDASTLFPGYAGVIQSIKEDINMKDYS